MAFFPVQNQLVFYALQFTFLKGFFRLFFNERDNSVEAGALLLVHHRTHCFDSRNLLFISPSVFFYRIFKRCNFCKYFSVAFIFNVFGFSLYAFYFALGKLRAAFYGRASPAKSINILFVISIRFLSFTIMLQYMHGERQDCIY